MIQGLYVHIPFCRSICTYCDFPKTVASASARADYVRAIATELSASRSDLADVETVYIGGGTPSMLAPDDLEAVLLAVEAAVDVGRLKEYTIEANPGDVDRDFVRLIRAHGIDRVSLGVQSGHSRLLALMGRTHTKADVERAVATFHEQRFYNLNLDFIHSLPTETVAELEEDLDFACRLQPTHLSFYTLILEPKTILWYEKKEGRLVLPDEETEARMFETVLRVLPERGYRRYEVSNFAIGGFESRHNLLYWNAREYLGVGMAAHSQASGRRFHNAPTYAKYLAAVRSTGFGGRIEDPCDLLQEACVMGLRKASGIDRGDIWRRFQTDVVRRYPRLLQNETEGLVAIDDRSVRLTDRGLIVMNYVERSFV